MKSLFRKKPPPKKDGRTRPSYTPRARLPDDYLYTDAPRARDLVNIEPIEIPDLAPRSNKTQGAQKAIVPPPPPPPRTKQKLHPPSSPTSPEPPRPPTGAAPGTQTIFPPPTVPPVATSVRAVPIETTCERYLNSVKKDPRFVLKPEVQWAVASRLEKLERWPEAAEAYQKLGALGIEHPRSADGLLRASYLTYKMLGDRRETARLLTRLIDKYPDSPQTEKAIKVLASLDRLER